MCLLNPTQLFHLHSKMAHFPLLSLSLSVSFPAPVCVFQNTVFSLTPGYKNVSLFFFFFFAFFFLFPLSSLSGSSGGKHSYSVPDQQSRAWQDSSTVDQEIRHIDGGPLTPRPRSTPTHPLLPSFPLSTPPSHTLLHRRPSFHHPQECKDPGEATLQRATNLYSLYNTDFCVNVILILPRVFTRYGLGAQTGPAKV